MTRAADDQPPLGEFGLIDWIKARARADARVPVGIGDDCAVLRAGAGGADLLLTTDMLMDGRHFVLDQVGPEAVGYKALAVNLSDIAAMAGRPVAAAISVALPHLGAEQIARGLFEGMAPLAERYGVALAGGDTNAWDGPLVVNVTLIGEVVPPGPVLRSGARPGDRILVTGPLGGSLLGRHLRPFPRIDEALALHRSCELRALIDLSDGLASDLNHILAASGGLGATLDASAIPVHDDARTIAARDGGDPLDRSLGDGEDFELCVVVSEADGARLLEQPPEGVTLHDIGRIEAAPGMRLRLGHGQLQPIQVRGFDHLR